MILSIKVSFTCENFVVVYFSIVKTQLSAQGLINNFGSQRAYSKGRALISFVDKFSIFLLKLTGGNY